MKKKSVLSIVLFVCLAFVFVPGMNDQAWAASKKTTKKAAAVDKGEIKGFKIEKATIYTAKLSWARNENATGYQIYRAESKNGSYSRVKSISGNTTIKWTDYSLKSGKTYYYKMKATNYSSYTDVKSCTTKSAKFGQQRATVSLSKTKDGTTISWTALSGVTNYRIYRSYTNASGSYTRLKTVGSGTRTYFDNQAASGKKCYYKVRGYKGVLLKNYTAYSFSKSTNTITRVYIAAGHGTSITGGWDSGCTYKGMSEAALMLPITKSFVKYMRQAGVYVYTDADAGNNKNMIACVREANKKELSAYMSIHCDYYKAASGTLPLYVSSAGKKLATALNNGVHSKVKIANRGLSKNGSLYELNMPDAPSCIYETGSISKDYNIFKKKYTAYGKGLAKGLCSYLGVTANF